MSLYDELLAEANYADAYIIAKNEYSHKPENIVAFKKFTDLMILLVNNSKRIDQGLAYIDEIQNAMTLFSESIVIAERSDLDLIKDYEQKIKEAIATFQARMESADDEEIASIIDNNRELFNRLSDLYLQVKNSESQETFDLLVGEISKIEESFEKDYFDDKQLILYENMTQSFSKLISEKMEDLNYQRLLETNETAVENLKLVIDEFNKKKALYSKSENELKGLLIRNMFSYDTRELFNETLIYYNHVYSTIFNGVNDDLKFKMTQWAVTAEKNQGK